jgi:hypothetical protein
VRRRRRLPPRPDVAHLHPRRRADRTIWVVAALFAAGAVVAAQIVVVAPGASPFAPAPTRSTGAVDAQTVPTDPDGPYAFLEATYVDGQRVPVRWNPCQPIEYQLHLDDPPLGTAITIADAIRQASDATGIAFRSHGMTSRDTHALISNGYFTNPLRSVYRPVLIDVVTHREFRTFHEPRRVVAFAHPQRGNGDLNHQYVAGFIVVDGGARFATTGRWSMELVVLHELGHLLGLGHVKAADELMYSVEVARHTVPQQIDGWGPGDLEGLRRLGASQGCLETVKIAG